MTTHDTVLRFVDPAAASLLARCPEPRRALFLDRDGVVNIDHGYVHTPARTDWVPGIFELLQSAHAAGFVPIVVTNQAGIARGLYDESEFLEYTRWMHGVFTRQGTPLLSTFFCPHHPQAGRGEYARECHCRKPQPGMIVAAAEAFSIDLAGSLLIGDKSTDIDAGVAAGVGRTRLVAGQGLLSSETTVMFSPKDVG